jgi:hypothetical protein
VAPAEAVTLHSFDDLGALLEREGVRVTAVDAASNAIEVATSSPPVEGAMAILWDARLQLVQFFHPLPFEIPAERLAAVEHALLLANDALVVPGFGVRTEKRIAYYRLVIPRRSDGSIDAADIQRAIVTVLTTLRDFWQPIRRIVEGADPDRILALAREGG